MVKRWYKKGLVVGIIVLFIGMAIASSININIVKASNDSDYVKVPTQTGETEIIKRESIELTTLSDPVEVVDQEQRADCGWGTEVHTRFWKAQSFTPKLNTLTKVSVAFFKTAVSVPGEKDFTVHIRASLTGEDLVNLTKDASVIPQWKTWVEFDFPDITLIPGNKYYIICEINGGTGLSCYAWDFQRDDEYKGGEAWKSNDSGVTWKLEEKPPTWVGLDCCFITYGLDEPPNIPIIVGPKTGKPGTPYIYTFTSIDPDGDNISYYIDWGDGNITDWTSYTISGTEYSESHNWTEKGTYNITAKTKDIYDVESDWGTLTVNMPRNKATNNMLLLRLLEQFPLLEEFLSRLINNLR